MRPYTMAGAMMAHLMAISAVTPAQETPPTQTNAATPEPPPPVVSRQVRRQQERLAKKRLPDMGRAGFRTYHPNDDGNMD
jgi:hypothetical protein